MKDENNRRMVRNAVRCLNCDDVIESTHRHDMKWCKCGHVAVDGGLDYVRRAIRGAANFEELTAYIDAQEKR